jgi:peptide-methionine (S)-S-oxide reductase
MIDAVCGQASREESPKVAGRPASNSLGDPDTRSILVVMSQSLQQATLAAGCFWCVEAVFQRLDGVRSVVSGYSNGHDPDPDYKKVCTGETGHAEVVRIEFDPDVISFAKLLDVFWRAHDPTTLNRQGVDEGTQYRSGIYWHDEEQREIAGRSKAGAAALWEGPIVTEIEEVSNYHPAEDYHLDYFRNHPENRFCQVTIPPKLKKSGLG